MMDWTDRHCRYLHRCLSQRSLLYTEMVTAPAILHGDVAQFLGHDPREHPLALQLGGADPDDLAQAVRLARDFDFDEINLNVGCPSDRVQSGSFGAALMLDPGRVAECVAAMIDASEGPEITVKCRIGVDDQVPRDTLPAFLETLDRAGIKTVIIHARKAWLEGLSPKQNRDVPPLDYPLVLAMKRAFAHLDIVVNGGITSLRQAEEMLATGLDGVMIGRAAYYDPAAILGPADARIFGEGATISPEQAVTDMMPYIEAHLASGGRLNHITRHMLGLFNGRPGARSWRRILSEGAHLPNAGTNLVEQALSHVPPLQEAPHSWP